ncbi:MAG TPA: ABC transporter ATP-binding protein [Marmoricola sp.]
MTLDVAAVVRRGEFVLDVALGVAPGERLGVVGPNGSGKSTLLRAIAGLVPIGSGSIRSGSRLLAEGSRAIPAEERRVALVFQDHRLFPHLTVLDNVAYGPRAAGVRRRPARAAAQEWLGRLDIADLAGRRPAQLSGGQSQRVALARALAQEPEVLLLDEPTAALDADARISVRAELGRHLAGLSIPTILVTHDPVEALVMTDRLVVLEQGRVVQTGTPAEIASRPATPYVARLMGLNLYAGNAGPDGVVLSGGGRLDVADRPGTGAVLVSLRPSAITVHLARPEGASHRNVWPATVDRMEVLGDRVRLHVTGEPDALVDVTPASVAELGLAPGVRVWLSAKATEATAYAR